MSLPTVNLDDRRFDDILREAKRRIATLCPEWTDHHPGDPGMALVELFAWMTDLLLCRVNQVPHNMLVTFLDLIGVTLDPARAAVAPLTFYLGAPMDTPVVVPGGTEVATVRTEASGAVTFTTDEAVHVRPARLLAAFSGHALPDGPVMEHDLASLAILGGRVPVFGETPDVGHTFSLCLDGDLSRHVLALVVRCELAGGAGIDPRHPPFVWEAWQGGLNRWARCVVEFDGTGGFNRPGEIVLRLPDVREETFHGRRGSWVRCRLTGEQRHAGYRVSPDLEALRVESRGITVHARHAVYVRGERLGVSDGTPGQTFRLLHAPVLTLDSEQDVLETHLPGEPPQAWQAVDDFAESGPSDHHWVLDHREGTVTFGPALLQPDGSVYRYGAVPPEGAVVRIRRYGHGGGVTGNVPAGALRVLRSPIPGVARVTNHEAAMGGLDPEPLDAALLKVPRVLRTRTRAVTADDYEVLAEAIPGVGRARCVTPQVALDLGRPDLAPQGGRVLVAVLPRVEMQDERIPPDRLTLSAELRAAVRDELDRRRVLGTILDVRAVPISWLSVHATLRVHDDAPDAARAAVRREAERVLYRHLNPFTGGKDGTGWPFGRPVAPAELYGLLRAVPDVEFVEEVRLFLAHADGRAEAEGAVTGSVVLPPHGLVASDVHVIHVT